MLPIALGLVAAAFCATAPPQEGQPRSLWADFNADGFPDVYVFGDGSTDRLLWNDGCGGFSDGTREAGLGGLTSRSAQLGDLDGDGTPDLLRLTQEGTPRIHLGHGRGSYGSPISDGGLGLVVGLVALHGVDLDGDGDLDLTGHTALGESVALENTGELAFAPPTVSRSLGSSSSPTWSASGAPLDSDPLESAAQTAGALLDQGVPGATLSSSSIPTLGMLYPLSSDFYIDANADVGLGTDTPLSPLHVTETSISLSSGATTLDTIVAEDPNAILGLYSDDGGSFGSGIVLGEVVAGALVDKWSIVRNTTGAQGDLVFAYGTSPAYNLNTAQLSLTTNGQLVLGDPSSGQDLSIDSANIVQPFRGLTIDAAGDLDLICGSDLYLRDGGQTFIQPQQQMIVGTDDLVVDVQIGRVGIGTLTPAFDLHVNGSAGKPGGGSWSTASDRRLKKNIHTLRGSLRRLLELRGVTYEYIDPDAIGELDGVRTGMIAQEVAAVFPDWVAPAEDGYLRLTFRGFEAEVVEALRELNAENERKGALIRELQQRLSRLEASLE